MSFSRVRLIGMLSSLLCLVLTAVVLQGCGSEKSTDGRVAVVATTPVVKDLVANIGGDSVDVKGVLPVNADPHEYEPRPGDIEALSEAKLVVRSGGEVDDWLDRAIKSSGSDGRVITLLDQVNRVKDDEGEIDPHWWHNPGNAALAVAGVQKALSEADPARKDEYSANAEAYLRKVSSLESQLQGCFDAVPAEQRKLVTTHEALRYLANRYDIDVVGEIIPSLSSVAQPSTGEVAELVKRIKAENVRAIFPEHGLQSKVDKAIAREAGIPIGKPLWADSLGAEDSDGSTYLKMMAANAAALVEGFTEGKQKCSVRT